MKKTDKQRIEELEKRVEELERDKKIAQQPLFPDPPVQYVPLQDNNVYDHYERCGCNPKNGGSGICMCVISSRTHITW